MPLNLLQQLCKLLVVCVLTLGEVKVQLVAHKRAKPAVRTVSGLGLDRNHGLAQVVRVLCFSAACLRLLVC